ncbi:unnamed protein product [Phytomonas sp. Hart1]|nr:unnamed protein product [Phytomonas sp. Hart1]|eukprot:CCW69419.1 unnamed protein product [Phytomonas sp. isolate Hart1]
MIPLRIESLRAYRKLFLIAAQVSHECPLHNKPQFLKYISSRFNQEAEINSRRLAHALLYLEKKERCLFNEPKKGLRNRKKSSVSRRMLNSQRKKILRDYQTHVSHGVDSTYRMAELLPHAVGTSSLTSLLEVLAAGVGNTAYQRRMESSFIEFFNFERKKEARDDASEEATSERQNRIMQQALIPYAEHLLLLHRTAVGEPNPATNLLYLTPSQMTEAIVGTRSSVSAHHLRHGNDHIVVEIDEAYNKQVIYIACACPGEGAHNGSYDWEQEIERVEVENNEEVRRTTFHAEFLSRAKPMCTTLLQETPLHVSRRTVLVGHAVGGSIALILSLLLSQRGFDITNVITLGAPKALQGTLERYIAAINPIRVVLTGDPLVELPVMGAHGDPFVHVGEILLLTPHHGEEATANGSTRNSRKSSSVDETPTDRLPGTCTPSIVTSATTASPVEGCYGDLTAEKLNMLMNDLIFEAPLHETNHFEGIPNIPNPQPGRNSRAGSPSPMACKVPDSVPETEEDQLMDEPPPEEASEEPESLFRLAKERYCAQFLVEHYVRHLCDPNVELTYAEGDEVWDEGSYAAARREAERVPHVSYGEQFQRDLRGPL